MTMVDVLMFCFCVYAYVRDHSIQKHDHQVVISESMHTRAHHWSVSFMCCVCLSSFVILNDANREKNIWTHIQSHSYAYAYAYAHTRAHAHIRTQIKLQQSNNGRCDYVNSLSMLSNIFMWVNRVFKKLHTCMRDDDQFQWWLQKCDGRMTSDESARHAAVPSIIELGLDHFVC